MNMLLMIWVVCLCVTGYYAVLLRKSGIYPPKRVVQSRARKWGMASGCCFFIWFVILFIR
ncbi:hypothetical protein V7068_14925 [Bacillus sp. JJ634]